MAAKKKSTESVELSLTKLDFQAIELAIVGVTPFICNAMSAKVRQDLLMPPKKKNKTERETTLKHDPLAEFRRSPYYTKSEDDPTLIICPAGAVKNAIASAALDVPGAKKTEIGRLSWIVGRDLPLYGLPEIFCSVVRNSDMARTPDVRTRAILPEWAMTFTIQYVVPNLTHTAIANLLEAAGLVCGLGDWRQQKGKGNYGQFRVTTLDDPELRRIMKVGGHAAQSTAMEAPIPHDNETRELLDWYESEANRRGLRAS